MSLMFYSEKEDIPKKESINNYNYLFKEYIKNNPCLNEALNQMYVSTGLSDEKVNELIKDILIKSEKIIEFNFDLINEKYPLLTRYEAKIIASYLCEAFDPNYSPYKILNTNLCEENRNESIKKISMYFFIFLKALRKLDKYYPNKKYMYRRINKQVKLEKDYLNKDICPYTKGTNRTFYSFISITSEDNMIFNVKGKKKSFKKGTIFDLCGKIWGYDISLFNPILEEHIILEPEVNFLVRNAIPPSKNEIVHVRCIVQSIPEVLINLDKPEKIYTCLIDRDSDKENNIRIFGKEFVRNNKSNIKILYKGKNYELTEYFSVPKNIKVLDIKLVEIGTITNMSFMFYNCESLLTLPDISNLNTSCVTNMSFMFYNCKSLLMLPDISNWDISKVQSMNYMFYNCKSLTFLPKISKWDISSLTTMDYMFYNCQSLISLFEVSKWNYSNVTSESAFDKCYSLSYFPEQLNKICNYNKPVEKINFF